MVGIQNQLRLEMADCSMHTNSPGVYVVCTFVLISFTLLLYYFYSFVHIFPDVV